MDGAISIIWRLIRCYHSGVEPIPGLAPRKALHHAAELEPVPESFQRFIDDVAVFLALERAGRVHKFPAAGETL
jgi:hypothetical protein